MKLKNILHYFVAGLSALFPITLTLYVLYRIFLFIDSISSWAIVKIFGENIVGLGFLLTMSAILLFGFLTRNYLIAKILELFEKIALRIPLVQVLYSGLKELAGLFSSADRKKYTQVVSLKFPNSEVDSIGFLTKDEVLFDGIKKVAVFIPTTPNPGNGFLIYTEPKNVVPLEIGIEEAIKCVVSMGTISPGIINSRSKKPEEASPPSL